MTDLLKALNETVAHQVTESSMLILEALQQQIDEKLEEAKQQGGTVKTLVIQEIDKGKEMEIDTPHPKLELSRKALNHPDKNFRNVYHFGPAGAGKSVLGYQIAQAMDIPAFVLSTLTAKYEVGGFNDAMGKYVESVIYKWLSAEAGVLICEELDRGHAAAVICLNELLASGKYTFANGEVLERTELHVVCANGNTNMQGRDRKYAAAQIIDGSTRDRFAFIPVAYDEAFEITITPNLNWTLRVQKLREAAEKLNLDVLITTRAALAGWALLKQKESQETVEELYVLRGASSDVVSKLYAEAGKPSTVPTGKVINYQRGES